MSITADIAYVDLIQYRVSRPIPPVVLVVTIGKCLMFKQMAKLFRVESAASPEGVSQPSRKFT